MSADENEAASPAESTKLNSPSSNVISFYDRNLLIEFIRTYRDLPELWKAGYKNYGCKKKRLEAMGKLLEILQRISPSASLNDVRNKIKLLRTNYRKEAKKILESKRSGATGDDVYTPQSWLYSELKFLEETEIKWRRDGRNEQKKRRLITEEGHIEMEVGREVTVEDAVSPAGAPGESYETEEDEAVANGWATRLTNVNVDQRLFAEKAINDLLFEAQLEALNENSLQVNGAGSVNPLCQTARIQHLPTVVTNSDAHIG